MCVIVIIPVATEDSLLFSIKKKQHRYIADLFFVLLSVLSLNKAGILGTPLYKTVHIFPSPLLPDNCIYHDVKY